MSEFSPAEKIYAEILNKVLAVQEELSRRHIDNFHVPERRRNSHRKHLRTVWLRQAEPEDLVRYYGHLLRKRQKHEKGQALATAKTLDKAREG